MTRDQSHGVTNALQEYAGISSCTARRLLQDRQLCSMIMQIKGIAAAAGSGRTKSCAKMLTLLQHNIQFISVWQP